MFRVYSECFQSMFRVCSVYFQGMFRVCSGCAHSVLRVCSKCAQNVFNVCFIHHLAHRQRQQNSIESVQGLDCCWLYYTSSNLILMMVMMVMTMITIMTAMIFLLQRHTSDFSIRERPPTPHKKKKGKENKSPISVRLLRWSYWAESYCSFWS